MSDHKEKTEYTDRQNSEEESKKCELERKEYLEGWQRSKADFINYKKDEAKRFEVLTQFALSDLAEAILPVLDSFDLALHHSKDKESEKGLLLIKTQLEDILAKRELKEIAIKIGENFNPEKHESLGEVESDGEAGVVAEVIQKGYALNERVLRPARVKVSAGKKITPD